ncbi:MAG TPA: hypothetical protein VHO26_10545 [Propionibacteriaceae bacterium]|nr:hypothetical protein [Propionibacteriaceae bacterium]
MAEIELNHENYEAYLNQHLVSADGGVKLFKAAEHTWAGTSLESVFRELHDELTDSHAQVKNLIERLGYQVSAWRNVSAGLAEVVGLVNPVNFTRHPYGKLAQPQLDSLAAAIRAQQMLWETLVVLADVDDRLDKEWCRSMIARCEDQRARVAKASSETVLTRFTVQPGE